MNLAINTGKFGWLRAYQEDAEQYVLMNLVKMFSKRFKYGDWDFVVKTAIRRKVIDFFNRQYSKYHMMRYSSNLASGLDEDGDLNEFDWIIQNGYSGKKYKQENAENHFDYLDTIKYIYNRMINSKDLGVHFNEWDKEYLEIVIELYEYRNSIDVEDIMECLGIEVNLDNRRKFLIKVKAFQRRLKEYFITDKNVRSLNVRG